MEQGTKKLMSYSTGLEDFAVGLSGLYHSMPNGQVNVLAEFFGGN